MNKLIVTPIIAVAIVALTVASAAAKMVEVPDTTMITETVHGIKFTSGGVGIEERDRMARIEKNYNLRLIFAVRSGAYLAHIKTVISSPEGKVLLDMMANGPWVFVKLPEGQYKVTATNAGKSKTKEITIGKNPLMVMFHWGK